jgi:hypothetical protein
MVRLKRLPRLLTEKDGDALSMAGLNEQVELRGLDAAAGVKAMNIEGGDADGRRKPGRGSRWRRGGIGTIAAATSPTVATVAVITSTTTTAHRPAISSAWGRGGGQGGRHGMGVGRGVGRLGASRRGGGRHDGRGREGGLANRLSLRVGTGPTQGEEGVPAVADCWAAEAGSSLRR